MKGNGTRRGYVRAGGALLRARSNGASLSQSSQENGMRAASIQLSSESSHGLIRQKILTTRITESHRFYLAHTIERPKCPTGAASPAAALSHPWTTTRDPGHRRVPSLHAITRARGRDHGRAVEEEPMVHATAARVAFLARDHPGRRAQNASRAAPKS